jgi:hypothetical protein
MDFSTLLGTRLNGFVQSSPAIGAVSLMMLNFDNAWVSPFPLRCDGKEHPAGTRPGHRGSFLTLVLVG